MQCQDITKQSNQCPRFFRVPAPEPSPGVIRPNTAENCASGKQQNAELEHAIQPEMHRRILARCRGIARVSPQQDMPKTHCQRERRVAQRDGKHMNGEPEIIAQHWNQRLDARWHRDRHLMHKQKCDERDRQCRKQIDGRPVTREKDHPKKRNSE